MEIFISYSRHDADVARKLAEHLKHRGHAAFIDYLGIRGGEEFVQILGQAIDASDVVLVLLSGLSISSQWVRWEIGWALKQHKQMVPILLESVSFMSIFPLASMHYLDFRDTSDAARVSAFRELDSLLAQALPPGRRKRVRAGTVQSPPHDRNPDGQVAEMPEKEVYRLATESITAREEAPETTVYLGRLVLQQSPDFLAGWLQEFVEGIEADLRQARVMLLAERLQNIVDDDLELAEQVAQDILFLDSGHTGAAKALRRIQLDRQCSELYATARRVMPSSRASAFFLLSEVQRLCANFPDRDNLLANTQISPASARLVRQVATVGPDMVHPHPHCKYSISPAKGLVALADFSIPLTERNPKILEGRGNAVAVYRPGDANSLSILEPTPVINPIDEYGARVTSVALSVNGDYVAASTRHGKTVIWKTSDPAHPLQLDTSHYVLKLAFNPAGDILATMTTSYQPSTRGIALPATLSVWEVKTGRCLRRLPDQQSGRDEFKWRAREASIVFGDRPTVVAATWDGYVRVWDYEADEVIANIHMWDVCAVGLNRNQLAVDSPREGFRFFELTQLSGLGEAQNSASTVLQSRDHGRARHLVFSPSGEILAAVRSYWVELWDLAIPRLLQSVQTEAHEPKSAVFSADGTQLFIQNAVLGVGLDAPLKQWPGL